MGPSCGVVLGVVLADDGCESRRRLQAVGLQASGGRWQRSAGDATGWIKAQQQGASLRWRRDGQR